MFGGVEPSNTESSYDSSNWKFVIENRDDFRCIEPAGYNNNKHSFLRQRSVFDVFFKHLNESGYLHLGKDVLIRNMEDMIAIVVASKTSQIIGQSELASPVSPS